MKLRGRHLVVALVALALGALPAYAQSVSPFRDYRDAAADQYSVTPTTTTTTTTTTGNNGPSGTGTSTPVGPAGSVTPQSEGTPTTGTTTTATTPDNTASGSGPGANEPPSGEGNAPSSGAGKNPVKVTPAKKAANAKGTLPFTGSDLTIFVLIALALILAGTLLAIAERKTRARRSAPPAS
jgi:hypothetical protein